MGCSFGSEAMVFPQNSIRSIKSLSNIRTSNLLRSNNKLMDSISQAVTLKQSSPTHQQLAFAADILSNHQLFNSLSPEEIQTATSQMILASAHKGTTLFDQGDQCSSFFIILSGTVEVYVDSELVRTLSTGQAFGELALLFRCPRTASVVCRSTECLFLLMKPGLFRATLQKMKMEEQEKCLASIGKVPLFGCLTNKQKFAISNAIKLAVFQPGQVIFQKDDDVQMVYILSEGLVKISIPHKGDILLREGQIFGEASLADHQDHHRRKGTAMAVQRSVCSIISRKDLQTALGSSINNLVFYNRKRWALMRSPIFKNLTISEIHQTIIEFKPVYIKDGVTLDQNLYKGFIICLEGNINNQEEGMIFNENHWKNKTFNCNVLSKNGDGYCSYLSFNRAQQLFEEFDSQTSMLMVRDNLQQKLTLNNHKLNLNDFTFIKKIGEGQFGKVLLVKNNRYGNHLYALKCMSKQEIRKDSLEATVINERRILQKTIFPYIVGFVKAFQDEINLYLLMEYIHGKDLFDVIRQAKKVTYDMSRYYIGCLILSIEYLHMQSIVYRDLKPQNIVVDWKGKLLLVDFGTAVMLTPNKFYKTFTIIGTPHYMAPEVFQGKGYSFQVDLWSLGCLLFELTCYSLPFGEKTDDPYQIYSEIKQKTPKFPQFVKDQNVKELIGHLLTTKAQQRKNFTFEKIKRSAYFKGFNWKKLLHQQMTPPYVPPCFQNWKMDELLKVEGKRLFKYLYSREGEANLKEWNQQFQ